MVDSRGHLVDLAGGEVVVPREGDVEEALVVTQIQVHLVMQHGLKR